VVLGGASKEKAGDGLGRSVESESELVGLGAVKAKEGAGAVPGRPSPIEGGPLVPDPDEADAFAVVLGMAKKSGTAARGFTVAELAS
jgi:hypothetical protein